MLSHRITAKFCLLSTLILCGCATEHQNRPTLRLGTTTTTVDSGLIDRLLPAFQTKHNARVVVITAGTGKILKLAQRGDVDVVLVHSRSQEDAFLADGFGVRREDVMHNRFELVGPADDPAEVRTLGPPKALQQIASAGQPFVSRGDHSGTHLRELELWQADGGLQPWPQYRESGQGMGATLTIANQLQAYTLCDRGTYLHFRKKIDLVPLVSASVLLDNPYGAIVVNPKIHPAMQTQLAEQFVDFLISNEAQQIIRDYRLDDEPLFRPAHATSAN